MPLYNKAPYVRRAIESIVGQTYTDWNLTIVDDGSTDGSGDIASNVSDTRIRMVRQENMGVGAARNRGVEECVGRYVCFLDADDWWEPTFLEEIAGLVERYPDAGIYATGYYIVKNGRRRIAPIGWPEKFEEGEVNYYRVYANTLCMPLTSSTVCIPRSVFEHTEGFPEGIKMGEDFLFWASIANVHKVVLLNRLLANYNQDVDTTFRGTHHLYPPQAHMLWNLHLADPKEESDSNYKQLVDDLRTYGLLPYYISKEYHMAAKQELAKVDWGRQPKKYRRLYRLPIQMLRIRQRVMKIGSNVKQKMRCLLDTLS